MGKKRSQVTIFIIIGLVLFLTFIVIDYSARQVERARLETEAERIVADIQQTSAIDYYVSLCLKKVTEEGLKLMGKQGGNIYYCSDDFPGTGGDIKCAISASYAAYVRCQRDKRCNYNWRNYSGRACRSQ